MKTGDTSVESRGGQFGLSLGTFNIRYGSADDKENSWENRRQILVDCIAEMAPDVLSVQEALPFQIDAITQAFPRLGRFGLGRFHGAATERAHESYSGEHCDVLYDTNRLGLLRWGTFWHSATPDVPASRTWGNSLPRITTWGVLRSRTTGVEFAVVNTHLHWDEPYVSRAAELLVTAIGDLVRDYPVVLTGDFNVTPESTIYRTLTTELALRDSWVVTGGAEEATGTSHRFEGIPRRRIDWVLVGSGIAVDAAQRVLYEEAGRYPSDHFPVLVSLRI